MRHTRGNGINGHSRGRGFISPQEELRRYKAICNHPAIKAVMIQVVTTTPQQSWPEKFPNVTYPQAQDLVTALASEEAFAALTLIRHQLEGSDVLASLADRNAIPKVAQETQVPAEALGRLAATVEAIRRTTPLASQA